MGTYFNSRPRMRANMFGEPAAYDGDISTPALA